MKNIQLSIPAKYFHMLQKAVNEKAELEFLLLEATQNPIQEKEAIKYQLLLNDLNLVAKSIGLNN